MSTNLSKAADYTAEEDLKWTAKMIEDHFEEAITTLRKLPPVKQKGYLCLWPNIIYSPNELIFQEKKPMRLLASPEAIARLDKVFEWMSWISIEERKLIWKRAARVRWKTICRELGCERTSAWRRWNIACNKIAACLNARENKD